MRNKSQGANLGWSKLIQQYFAPFISRPILTYVSDGSFGEAPLYIAFEVVRRSIYLLHRRLFLLSPKTAWAGKFCNAIICHEYLFEWYASKQFSNILNGIFGWCDTRFLGIFGLLSHTLSHFPFLLPSLFILCPCFPFAFLFLPISFPFLPISFPFPSTFSKLNTSNDDFAKNRGKRRFRWISLVFMQIKMQSSWIKNDLTAKSDINHW